MSLCCGSFFAQIPVANDDLPARILAGRVQVKPNVKELRGSTVVFSDGSSVDKVCFNIFVKYASADFVYLSQVIKHDINIF